MLVRYLSISIGGELLCLPDHKNEEQKLASAQNIVDELKKQGITHVVGVPDNGSARIYEILRAASGIEVITVTREGEAFAIASGLYVGGKKPVIIIQNTGFLESGDAIRGTVLTCRSQWSYSLGIAGITTVMQMGIGLIL